MWRRSWLIGWLLCSAFHLLRAEGVLTLHRGWEFREVNRPGWLPATVPGDVHLDLHANGQIPDPYFRDNESRLQWVGKTNWEYRLTFTCPPGALQASWSRLRFQGLDTYAEVFLNGKSLLHADNMFREWVVPVEEALHPGSNELLVRFHSPMEQATPLARQLPYVLPQGNDSGDPPVSAFVRKAPHHFGWDWGPRFLAMGIWRPVHLEYGDGPEITDLWLETLSARSETGARTRVHVALSEPATQEQMLRLSLGGEDFLFHPLADGEQHIVLDWELPDARLWWPRGYGEQNLYRLQAQLLRDKLLLDEAERKVGIREVELIQTPSAGGTSFFFKINGLRIFAKGANLVPADFFPARADARAPALADLAAASNMNMLRIWGGGIYPNEAFLARCDSLGLLIWQDFMFACSMYPGDSAFLANVEQEAREQITTLRRHPSLAIWCGNNESNVAWFNWGWQGQYGYSPSDSARIRQDYEVLFDQLLPELLQDMNPELPYIGSSPLSNWGKAENFLRGNMHYWGVWHGTDRLEAYRTYVPRFMSEFGFQSYPTWECLQSFTYVTDREAGSAVLQHRQKSYRGSGLIHDFVGEWYGEARDFRSLVQLSQLVQMEGMDMAIRAHRTAQPFCGGTLFWQMNDVWPALSWSAWDYQLQPKAFGYRLAELYAPNLLEVRLQGDSIRVATQLDTLQEARLCTLQVEVLDLASGRIRERRHLWTVHPRRSNVFPWRQLELGGLVPDAKRSAVRVRLLHEGEVWAEQIALMAHPREVAFPQPEVQLQLLEDGRVLELRARTFLKNVFVSAKDSTLLTSDNYFDMWPGEVRQIRLSRPMAPMDLELETLVNWMK